jgi:hypothetical protein
MNHTLANKRRFRRQAYRRVMIRQRRPSLSSRYVRSSAKWLLGMPKDTYTERIVFPYHCLPDEASEAVDSQMASAGSKSRQGTLALQYVGVAR